MAETKRNENTNNNLIETEREKLEKDLIQLFEEFAKIVEENKKKETENFKTKNDTD
jgi:hypothetical protein